MEAMYAIPVMLLVYLIGAQLWSITWNAQYAHIKARYDVHEQANHKPCFANQGGDLGGGIEASASATTNGSQFYGGRFLPTSRNRTLKAKYRIECNS